MHEPSGAALIIVADFGQRGEAEVREGRAMGEKGKWVAAQLRLAAGGLGGRPMGG